MKDLKWQDQEIKALQDHELNGIDKSACKKQRNY